MVDFLQKVLRKNAIFSKVAGCRTYATLQKISSFTIVFQGFKHTFHNNQFRRSYFQETCFFGTSSVAVCSLVFFLFFQLHLSAPSQHDTTEATSFTVHFFNNTILNLSRSSRYLKNYIGNILFKTTAAKKDACNSFFQNDTNNIHRVSHNGVNAQKVI